jgi:dCMP deaminase
VSQEDLAEIFNQKVSHFDKFKDPSERISWHKYFFGICYLVSERSPDAQTKHGSVIVDKENRIVATGYNGFPSGGPDNLLPNLRPEKYPYMVHAEMNALISARCNVGGYSVYVTGFPCKSCLLHLVAAGVRKIFCGLRTHQEDADSAAVRAVICETYSVSTYMHSPEDMGQIQLCDPKKWLLGS